MAEKGVGFSEDGEPFVNMSKNQLLSIISQAWDSSMQDVATKADCAKLVDKLDKIIDNCSVLKRHNDENAFQQKKMMKSLENIDNKLRSRNLIFRGFPIEQGNPRETIQRLCENFVSEGDKFKIHSARSVGGGAASPIILVKFQTEACVNHVMKNVSRLKGTGRIIHRDFAKPTRLKHGIFLSLKRQILKVDDTAHIRFGASFIEINADRFVLTPERLLIHESTGEDGLAVLNEKFHATFTIEIPAASAVLPLDTNADDTESITSSSNIDDLEIISKSSQSKDAKTDMSESFDSDFELISETPSHASENEADEIASTCSSPVKITTGLTDADQAAILNDILNAELSPSSSITIAEEATE